MTVITAAFQIYRAPSTGRSTDAGASGFDPVAEPPASGQPPAPRRMAAIRASKAFGPASARTDDDLQLRPVLVVIAQGRQRHLWLARLAVAG